MKKIAIKFKFEFEIFNEEIVFKISKEDNIFNRKELFNKLDNYLEELYIKSYSKSMSTLEDVFNKIEKKYIRSK